MTVGIPNQCAGCATELHAHNLTRLCAECKLVARNHRLSGQPADTTASVTPEQAGIAALTAVLGGRIIHEGEQLT